jgi:Zn-dependent peptidase ImmA (M78 family)
MNQASDLRARPRGTKAIEQLTRRFRQEELGLDDEVRVEHEQLVRFLENRMEESALQTRFEVCTRDDMGPHEGRFRFDESFVIQLRDDVYEGLCYGHARPLATAVHEIGHAMMHRREIVAASLCPQPVVLARTGDPPYLSAEWQGWEFAAATLMPPALILAAIAESGVVDSESLVAAIVRRSGVSRSFAASRVRQLQRRSELRSPYGNVIVH